MSTQRFDIRHAPAPRESFRLLYISKSKFGGDWNSTTHTHSCTELFYCLSGEGQFYLAGQLFPVKPDDMVIVNPQVEHTELEPERLALGVYRAGRCQHGVFSKCFTILRILARAVSFFCRSITLALLNFCVSSHLHCSVRLTQVELSADTANTTGGSGNRAARCVRL